MLHNKRINNLPHWIIMQNKCKYTCYFYVAMINVMMQVKEGRAYLARVSREGVSTVVREYDTQSRKTKGHILTTPKKQIE